MTAEEWAEQTARLRAKLAAMMAWRERPLHVFALEWPCAQCGAQCGEPCRKPNGDPYTVRVSRVVRILYPERVVPSVHVPRGTPACRTANATPTWLRSELAEWERWNDPPRIHERQLRSALKIADNSLVGKHLQARGEWPA
jgi:hypothetical protein